MKRKLVKAAAVFLAGVMMAGSTSFSAKAAESTKENIPTIHIAGDSTVKTYRTEDQFIGGWGEMISKFMDTSKVNIRNYAEGGRSTRSFINEGRLIDNGNFTTNMNPKGMGAISDNIKPGDYLIVQFGHNDDETYNGYSSLCDRMAPLGEPDANGIYPSTPGVKVPTTHLPQEYFDRLNAQTNLTAEQKEAEKEKTLKALKKLGDTYYSFDCGGTYKWYLKQYIKFARDNGATPILVTSVSRREFGSDGKIASHAGHHGGSDKYHDFTYVEAVKQVAKEENVLLLDMFSETENIYNTLGSEDSKYLQSLKNSSGGTLDGIWIDEYNAHMINNDFKAFDNTHQNKFGSFLFSAKIAEQIKKVANSNTKAGVNGKTETIDKIAEAVYSKPTSYVQAPDKEKGRLDDIASLYTLVQPIEGKEVQTEKPGQGEEQKPGQGEEQKPGQGEEQKPAQGEEQKPGQGEEQKPGQGEEQKPGQGEEQKPGQGEEQKPAQGEEQKPAQGEEQKPAQDKTQETEVPAAGADVKGNEEVKNNNTVKTGYGFETIFVLGAVLSLAGIAASKRKTA